MAKITDVQRARAIIKKVGDLYQSEVSNLLRSLTYYPGTTNCEKKAQQVISNMESEYVLNAVNVLWANKYDEIPDYLKK